MPTNTTPTDTSDTPATTAEVQAFRAELDDVWTALDRILASVDAKHWTRRHGKDWTMADVPYHIAYFDAEIIAGPLERPDATPPAGQQVQRTTRELNAWNARRFAERPAAETPADSVRRMHASRERVRAAISRLVDADLDRPVWCFLMATGTRRVRDILTAEIAHTWSHVMQLRHYLSRRQDMPAVSTTRRALGFYARIMPIGVDRARASTLETPFVLGLEITGPAAAAFAIEVRSDGCDVRDVEAARLSAADIRLAMSPETFIKMFAEITNPVLLMLTRRIRVSHIGRLGAFGSLFPDLDLDAEVDPATITL